LIKSKEGRHKWKGKTNRELIVWIDADDVYFPSVLKTISEAYAKESNVSIYVGGFAQEDEKGIIQACHLLYSGGWEAAFGLLRVMQFTIFFNKKFCKEIGKLRKDLYIRMDGDYIYRLLKHRNKTCKVNKIIAFFRHHENSKSSTSRKKIQDEHKDFLDELGYSSGEYYSTLHISRLLHFVSGDYLKILLVINQYKRKDINEIWKIKGNND